MKLNLLDIWYREQINHAKANNMKFNIFINLGPNWSKNQKVCTLLKIWWTNHVEFNISYCISWGPCPHNKTKIPKQNKNTRNHLKFCLLAFAGMIWFRYHTIRANARRLHLKWLHVFSYRNQAKASVEHFHHSYSFNIPKDYFSSSKAQRTKDTL